MNSHETANISECRILTLPHHPHEMGTLTVAQNSDGLPFAIKRIFYIYDIPADSERGGHSHHVEQQLIIAVGGCFDVRVSDGRNERIFTLRRLSLIHI